MAIVEPAVVILSGTFENSERLGALPHHPECSSLVAGVVELPHVERLTNCRPAPIMASMSMHDDSGAGYIRVEWYV